MMSGLVGWKARGWAAVSNGIESRSGARSVLVSVIVVAVALRVVSAFYHGDTISVLPGVYDQISYDALARQVLAGHGFSFPVDWWPATGAGEPTAHWSFLYTLYLAGVYVLFGPHPLVARLIQAVVTGLVHPWLSWRIGTRLFGTRVGLVAAALSTLYPYFVYYSAALMTESSYILAILWAIDLVTTMNQSGKAESSLLGFNRQSVTKAKPWVLLGLALGTAALLRQVILLFVPFLLAWLVWAVGSGGKTNGAISATDLRRSAMVGMLISLVVLFSLIMPWTVRNYKAFGRLVLLNTNAGYAFFWANHPVYGTDFVPLLPDGAYQNLIPVEVRGLDEAALDQALLQEGLAIVANDPWRYVQLSVSRIPDYFEFWPSPESGLASNVARSLSFGLALPLALYGLFLFAVHHRFGCGRQRADAFLLCLFIAVYSSVHLLSWALIRYRLPVDAVLLQFAALALVHLKMRLAGRLPGST